MRENAFSNDNINRYPSLAHLILWHNAPTFRLAGKILAFLVVDDSETIILVVNAIDRKLAQTQEYLVTMGSAVKYPAKNDRL